MPGPGFLYLLGETKPRDYAARILRYIRQLREAMALETNAFKQSATYAINQASVYDLVNDRHNQSFLIAEVLGYHEYLLWDDGGLWTAADWAARLGDLKTSGWHETDAERRLAWTGSGWLAGRLSRATAPSADPWTVPEALPTWANHALERLVGYDLALIDHYRKTETRDPPGFDWTEQELTQDRLERDYLRCLCNFLPDHRCRDDDRKEFWLTSNSLADDGGPRPWCGVLDDRISMQLLHLLLDGWLTLWPVIEGEGTRLYYQPGSLALLYWAARRLEMPWTETPEAFFLNYDWSDGSGCPWFGGRRKAWKPDPIPLQWRC